MLKTTKYEFGKPEQNDFYDINVHNNNMDEIERALTEFDDSGKAEGITSFTDMFTKLATGNKLAVTLRNLKAGLQFCLHVGSIVNNCVTDNARLPLSAAQGKVLMDAVTKLNSDLKNTISSNGTVINPNIAKSVLTVFDGWDSNAANYNSFFKNKMSILITVWVWNNTIGNLEAERAQCMIHSSKIMYRYFDYNHNWSEWG